MNDSCHMNNFACIISFDPAAEAADYLQKIQHRFPARCSGLRSIGTGPLQGIGRFEASILNAELQNQPLFLDGEIFNLEELARTVNAQEAVKQHAASLLHTLILEKGIDAIAGVNGQFLIIYYDADRQTIHLLSDHAGVQQVFYYQGKDFFLFASDIKFLMAHPQCPAEIDWETSLRRPYPHTVLSNFRSYASWFRDIYLLPEATDCSIRYSDRTVTQRKFWNGLYDYKLAAPDDRRTSADIMEEYMALLDDAVEIRIGDHDKAFSFLSGGLDSSAICALAARHKPLDTYSIINQVTCIEDTTSVCADLGRDLGFGNTQFLIPYHELAFDKRRWMQRIWRTESPVNHNDALTKNMLHYAIGKHDALVPYVLTGTGSDQLNGGLVRWVVNDEETHEQSAEAFLAKVKEAELRHLISRDDDGLWRMRSLVHKDYLADIARSRTESNYWMYYVQSALHGETYSLLWDELRAASAHGRSVRFPFLDYRFVPFIASVPERLHRELFFDKPILRTPSKALLPEYVTTKGKAPSFIPGYDFRFRLFDFLTSGADSLLEAAFGDRSTPHAVIDKEQLWDRVEALKRKPEIYEWQELIGIINLGLLEQMAGKNERDMDFERDMNVPEAISFEDPAAAKATLQKRLSVKTDAEMLALPLKFAEGCALMQDYKTGTMFLAKNNALAYELDDEYVAWKALLQAIDGELSTEHILKGIGADFETVREFYMLALKEQILSLGTAVNSSKTEISPCLA